MMQKRDFQISLNPNTKADKATKTTGSPKSRPKEVLDAIKGSGC